MPDAASTRACETIDSHQHFWRVARGDYGWMGDHVAPLVRDFLPADLEPHLRRAGIARTVLVQAAPTEGETAFLLDLAARIPFVAGVVGWLDMDADDFPEKLAALRRDPWFVGLRPMLQDLPDDGFVLRPRVLRHMALLARTGTPLDILAFPRHLAPVGRMLGEVPELRAVVDHLAKPPVADGSLDPWREEIAALAAFPGVCCKVSGLVTEAGADWSLSDLAPFVDHVAATFGGNRLLFGSDWPVLTLRASYGEVANAARTLLGRRFGSAEMDAIFGGNAARFYGLGPAGSPPAPREGATDGH